jgi:hypothetical protein
VFVTTARATARTHAIAYGPADMRAVVDGV